MCSDSIPHLLEYTYFWIFFSLQRGIKIKRKVSLFYPSTLLSSLSCSSLTIFCSSLGVILRSFGVVKSKCVNTAFTNSVINIYMDYVDRVTGNWHSLVFEQTNVLTSSMTIKLVCYYIHLLLAHSVWFFILLSSTPLSQNLHWIRGEWNGYNIINQRKLVN